MNCNCENSSCMTCKHGCCTVMKIVKVLLIIGGLNWGLVGVGMLMGSSLNVVNMLLGSWPMIEAIIYIVVGVAAVMKIFGCKCKVCAACKAGSSMGGGSMTGSM
jgi:uncharacterized membrane protein YuzA (DUF378 family)